MNFRNYYRRPRETHRCGLSTAGRACVHGPNGNRCGQARDIPEQCTPVRTLLGWSRLVSSLCTLAAIGTVFYWFTYAKNNQPIAPGGLSKAHAQLLVSGLSDHPLSIDDEKRCAACHPNAIPNSSGLLAASAPDQSLPIKLASVRKQSELCMNCHQDSMPNGLLGNPHDLVGDDLSSLLASVTDRQPTKLSQEPTECSQCHREHQGSDGDLQAISSAKCQACHRNQFQSFSQGHPEFESYPPSKPRSIGFDHGRHAELHFAKKGKSFDCSVCHLQSQQSGLVGSVFRSVSFEQSCAECHSEPLKSAGIEGIVVLQVPSLDRAKLAKGGHYIGPWPESASLMMDGELSPLLLHMLRLSETGRSLLERLPRSGRLKDVDLDDPIQAGAIVELAAFVRETWGQLASNGQPMLKRWFETDSISRTNSISNAPSPQLELYARFVSARSTNDPETTLPAATPKESHNEKKELWANQLAMGVPPDLLRSASSKWFREEPLQSTPLPQPTPLSQSIEPERLPVVMSVNPISMRFEPIVTAKPLQDDDDLLTDSQEDLLTAPSNNPLSPLGKNDPLAEQDDLLSGSDNSALVLDDLNATKAPTTDKPLKPWEHLPYGGWMIDDNRVALVYVPTGHADPWVSRWIEWNLLLHQDYGPVEFQDGFLKQCVQCHSFDSQRIKQMLHHDPTSSVKSLTANKTIPVHHASTEDINGYCWKIEQRPNALRELTKFNHTPHLSINSLRDCQSCHTMKKLNEQQTAEQGWSDRGRATRSEFLPIQKNQCASCHTSRSSGDACTQCHNYHVHGLFRDH